jgi:hypothetical protein
VDSKERSRASGGEKLHLCVLLGIEHGTGQMAQAQGEM